MALAAALAHFPALFGGFVWLDHAHLEERLALAAPLDVASLFTHGFAGTGFYRPLFAVVLSVCAWVGGSPLVYHAVTLALHVAVSVLVVIAADALGSTVTASLVAGLLFAVHPLTSLVASAVAFGSEALVTALLLAFVVLHLRERALFAAMVLFAAALTKEIAFGLAPLFVVALEVSRSPRRGLATWRSLAAWESLAWAAAFALRSAFAPAFRARFVPLSLSEQIGTRAAALLRSIAAVLPVGVAPRTLCDATPITSLVSAEAILGSGLALAVLYWAWTRRGAALLAAIALLPSLQIVPVMRFWSPHYLYAPLAFAAVAAGDALVRHVRRPLPWAFAFALGSGVLAFQEDRRFRTDETLFRREVAVEPGCREAQFYLGEVERERGNLDRATHRYELALRETPGILSYVDVNAVYENLGVVRLSARDPEGAIEAFRAALARTSNPEEARRLSHNLLAARLMSGDAEGVAQELEPETSRPDALKESLLLRAKALHVLGRDAEAAALVARLQRDPSQKSAP